MKKENKLIAFFKRYSVVDMIRVSCGALLAFILIFLTSKEESWFVALMFSFGKNERKYENPAGSCFFDIKRCTASSLLAGSIHLNLLFLSAFSGVNI